MPKACCQWFSRTQKTAADARAPIQELHEHAELGGHGIPLRISPRLAGPVVFRPALMEFALLPYGFGRADGAGVGTEVLVGGDAFGIAPPCIM